MPNRFSIEDVERLAHLARVALAPDEKALFARQLSDVLDYARQILDVDTDGVPATSHPLGTAGPLRSDEVRTSLPRAEALAAAPEADHNAGLFKVPRVLG